MPVNGEITLTFAERMQFAGTGTVIGVLTVFVVLIFLWGVLVVMQKIFNRPVQTKQETVVEQPVSVPVQSQAQPEQDNTQLIAVLTAAVAAVLNTQNAATNFRIKSFRRTKS